MTATNNIQPKSLQYQVQSTRNFAGYKNILIEKIKALTGNDGDTLFDEVYGVEKTDIETYPACFVIQRAGRGELIDTHRNQREWEFAIVIHQEIGQRSPDTAYEALVDATDRVIKMLDTDPMLADENGQNQCKSVDVVSVNFEYAQREQAVHRSLIVVNVTQLVQRY